MAEIVLQAFRFGFLLLLWLFIFAAFRVVRADLFGGRAGSRPGVTHVLVVDGPGTRHELSTGRNVIGRGTEADIRLPDTGVSRKHADVQLHGTTVVVEDLGSTNGTLVNGRRVGRQDLADGDVIRIGHSVLVYRQDGT